MSIERIKKSLVILDQSLDTLEEVIAEREAILIHAKTAQKEAEDALSKQIDMFSETQAASNQNQFNREETVQKLDSVITKISDMLEA